MVTLVVSVVFLGLVAGLVTARLLGGDAVVEPDDPVTTFGSVELSSTPSGEVEQSPSSEAAFAAMQLLGETHLVLESGDSMMSVGNLRSRMVDLEAALAAFGCPLGLRRDIVEHLDIAASSLEIRAAATIEGNVEIVDAITRVADDLCRRSPVLVGRIGSWLDSSDEAADLAA